MQKPKQSLGVGLIGAGFMGKCHANAFRAVSGIFNLAIEPVAEILADATPKSAALNAKLLGFNRSSHDWKSLCHDDAVDIVAITVPNALHEPIVMEAISSGKIIYCEKPLSTTLDSARRMTEAAELNNILTMVGFNFLRNPMVKLTKEIVESGEIGEVVSFRGRHAENYMCDPNVPHSFRTDPRGGGATADIGSHIISIARYLLGPIRSVSARCHTIHKSRPVSPGTTDRAPVAVDDLSHSIVTFDSGVTGNIEANWAAFGRTMDLSFEITGTKGAIAFTQERMNELRVAKNGAGTGLEGFTKIETGPAHEPYGQFCPAPGHHLGFNDLKIIEVAELLEAVAIGKSCGTDFREAMEVQRVVEAIQTSKGSVVEL